MMARCRRSGAGYCGSAFLPCFRLSRPSQVLRWNFRKELRGFIESEVTNHFLTRHGTIVVGGLAATVAVLLIASVLNWDLGLPTLVTAMVVATAVSVMARTNPLPLLKEISWTTLLLVAGLFVMVEAVESIGAMKCTQKPGSRGRNRLRPPPGNFVVASVVAVANNLVNNLPLGLLAGSTLQATHAQGLIASAILTGVDLGPNLSITGSLATILWLIALRKEKLNVSFWCFLKVGAVAMPVALLAAIGGGIVMQLCFGIR